MIITTQVTLPPLFADSEPRKAQPNVMQNADKYTLEAIIDGWINNGYEITEHEITDKVTHMIGRIDGDIVVTANIVNV